MIVPRIPMGFGALAHLLHSPMIALVLLSACPLRPLAQDGHTNTVTEQTRELTAQQESNQGTLLRIVRDATVRFQDVSEAEREHYSLVFGCVSGPDEGAMGLHFLNSDLLDEVNKTGVLDPKRPQIVLYEAQPNGTLKLTGADFVVFAGDWDAKHPGTPPQLLGQIFQYFEAPNRFGLPAFYTLHVWAWKQNPNGAFVNWHPHVSCQSFVGQTTP